jgi:hypothetical protein
MGFDKAGGRLLPTHGEPDRRQAVKAGAIAPPLRGFGLDSLTPPRFGLSEQLGAVTLPIRNGRQRSLKIFPD